MGSIRIYQIAKENNISSKEVLEICQSLGIDVKSHSSTVDEEQLTRIIKALKNEKEKKDSSQQEKKQSTEKAKSSKHLNKQPGRKFIPQNQDEKEDVTIGEEFEVKNRQSSKWEEEKKINIRNVLLKELDKEDKLVRFRGKPKNAKEKEKNTTKQVIETQEKDEKISEEVRKRPEIKKIIEIPVGITLKQLSEKINISSN